MRPYARGATPSLASSAAAPRAQAPPSTAAGAVAPRFGSLEAPVQGRFAFVGLCLSAGALERGKRVALLKTSCGRGVRVSVPPEWAHVVQADRWFSVQGRNPTVLPWQCVDPTASAAAATSRADVPVCFAVDLVSGRADDGITVVAGDAMLEKQLRCSPVVLMRDVALLNVGASTTIVGVVVALRADSVTLCDASLRPIDVFVERQRAMQCRLWHVAAALDYRVAKTGSGAASLVPHPDSRFATDALAIPSDAASVLRSWWNAIGHVQWSRMSRAAASSGVVVSTSTAAAATSGSGAGGGGGGVRAPQLSATRKRERPAGGDGARGIKGTRLNSQDDVDCFDGSADVDADAFDLDDFVVGDGAVEEDLPLQLVCVRIPEPQRSELARICPELVTQIEATEKHDPSHDGSKWAWKLTDKTTRMALRDLRAAGRISDARKRTVEEALHGFHSKWA